MVLTNLTAGTYCVHSVNGLLQTTASDCGAGGGGAGGGWSTSTPNIIYNSFGTVVGINSSTPTANLTVQGMSGSTTPIFTVASSTNTQYLTVLAKGYVGIGSSTPSTQLAVTSLTSTVDPFDVSTSTSGSLFHVSANGNVGIGVANPDSNLEVFGSEHIGNFGNLTLDSGSYVQWGSSVVSFRGGASPNYLQLSTNGGTNGIYVNSAGSVGIGTSSPSSLLFVQNTSNGSTTPLLTVASSTGSTLLTVLANGNVGIGTSAPSQLLTVGNNNQFLVTSAGNASATNLTITSFSAANSYCVHSVNGLLQTTASDCGAGGGGGGGWATSSPNIIYNSFGTLVGINSTTPTANLTVQGMSGSSTPIFVVASSSNAYYRL